MIWRDGFNAEGEVSLLGSRIGGQLDLSGASLSNPDKRAMYADGLTIGQGIYGDGFTASGEVRLDGAHIKNLHMPRASLANRSGFALHADRLTVDSDMFFGQGFTAKGEVRLDGARIGGKLDLTGAHLSQHGGRALDADRLTVESDMLCVGLTANGDSAWSAPTSAE